jgi:hypothetical protein
VGLRNRNKHKDSERESKKQRQKKCAKRQRTSDKEIFLKRT